MGRPTTIVLRLLAVAVIATLFITAVGVGSKLGVVRFSSVQSGAEGGQVFVYGAQPAGTNTIYALGDNSMNQYSYQCQGGQGTHPCELSWGSGSGVYGATLQKQVGSSGAVTTASVTLNIPQQPTTGFGGITLNGQQVGQSIGYFITWPNGTKAHINGQIMQETQVMEFKPNGDKDLTFQSEAYWFHGLVNIWGVQMCDPGNTTICQNGFVWGAPLQAVITNLQITYCQDQQCRSTQQGGTNDQLNPMSQGSALSLYNQVTNSAPVGNPTNQGIDSASWQKAWADYIRTGGSPASPDPSIYQDVYYPIQFTNFGPFGCNFGVLNPTGSACFPDVTLTVTWYYLVVGTFIWTNPNQTPYVPSPQGPTTNLGDQIDQYVGKVLSDPFTWIVVLLLVGMAFVAILVLVPAFLRRIP